MRLDKKAIGARIRAHRQMLDLTQAQLAERTELDAVYVSQLERGQRTMSLPTLFRVAATLQVKPGSLLDAETDGEEDSIVHELRDILQKWDEKQRRAVLRALRALSEV